MIISFHPPFSLAITEIYSSHQFFLDNTEKEIISHSAAGRRKEFSSGRFAVRSAAAMFRPFNGSFSDLSLKYGRFGQPVTENGIFTSITHDSGFASALCWNNENVKAGIDIHHISDDAFITRSCWLDKTETGILDNLNDAERIYSFAWCAKESVSKAVCLGLKAFEDIVINSFSDESGLAVCKVKYDGTVFRTFMYEENGIIISLCFDETSAYTYIDGITEIINDLKGVLSYGKRKDLLVR